MNDVLCHLQTFTSLRIKRFINNEVHRTVTSTTFDRLMVDAAQLLDAMRGPFLTLFQKNSEKKREKIELPLRSSFRWFKFFDAMYFTFGL